MRAITDVSFGAGGRVRGLGYRAASGDQTLESGDVGDRRRAAQGDPTTGCTAISVVPRSASAHGDRALHGSPASGDGTDAHQGGNTLQHQRRSIEERADLGDRLRDAHTPSGPPARRPRGTRWSRASSVSIICASINSTANAASLDCTSNLSLKSIDSNRMPGAPIDFSASAPIALRGDTRDLRHLRPERSRARWRTTRCSGSSHLRRRTSSRSR